MVKEFILEDDLIIHRSCPLSDTRHPQGFPLLEKSPRGRQVVAGREG